MFSLISFAIQRVYKYPGKQKLRGMSDLDHSFCALGTTWNEGNFCLIRIELIKYNYSYIKQNNTRQIIFVR